MTPEVEVATVLKTSHALPWNHPIWHDVVDQPFKNMKHMRVLETDEWTIIHDTRDNSLSAYHYESGCIANSFEGGWLAA